MEREETILQYDEEDLYLKNIGFEEENSNLDGGENNGYIIDKKLLKNKD